MPYYPAIFRRAAAAFLATAVSFTAVDSLAANSRLVFDAKAKPEAKAKIREIAKDPMEHEFLERRVVRLTGDVNEATSIEVIRKLEYLDAVSDQDIELRISSDGGSVEDGMAIIDAIKNLRSSVRTVCEGKAKSMAAVILAVGTPGKREAMPSCSVMIHEPRSESGLMTVTELGIHYKDMVYTRRRMVELLSQYTGIDELRMSRMMGQDFNMTAQEALKLGFIDHIIQPRQKAPRPSRNFAPAP